jgi:tetratricopeptide (TPR) repeat protein
MNMHADLFYNLIRQPSALSDTPIEKIEQLTREYPWFGAAQQLLYLKKAALQSNDAQEQFFKATVYTQPQRSLELLNFNAGWNNESALETTTHSSTLSELNTSLDQLDALQDAVATIEAEESIDLLHGQDQVPLEQLDIPVSVTPSTFPDPLQEQDLEDAAADAMANVEVADQQEINEQETAKIKTSNSTFTEAGSQQLTDKETTPKPAFLFEPYHAVDYFASQGIKLKEEKLGNDELSRQLKTFTQWLRTMKKVYVEDKKELDPQQEKIVIDIASVSNQNAEILTETMADVLLQQGKKEQAKEIYHKLILLHPEKNSYFAQRIESLKS